MNKDEIKKSKERRVLIYYRDLIDFIRTTAKMSGRENGVKKFDEKIESLAKAKLKCSHKIIMPWQLKDEKDRIAEYAQQILRQASDYIQFSKFNNNYTNSLLLRKFNESCEKLAGYLEINPSHESEDKVEEPDFLANLKDPLTDENLKKYVELYYLGDERHSFYGNLMGENACDDTLNPDKYRALREKVFISEIEQMLKEDDEKYDKRCKNYRRKYIINKIKKPFYYITGNQYEYYKNNMYYSVAKKDIIADLRAMADKHGIDYLVKKYNEIRKQLDDEKESKIEHTEEECKIYWLIDYIRVYSHNIPGILSFFIDRTMYDDKGKYRVDNTVDIRYYINVGGEDIYKFTEEFVQMARDAGIPFHIKVVDAEKNESGRAERLVIYSSFEAMQKNLEFLRQIKKKHPEMKYGKPPITVATIDEWIGFGSEPKAEHCSYNSERAKLIEAAIKEVFGKKGSEEDGKKIMDKINNNPELLKTLKEKIAELSESYGVSKEYFALDKDHEEYFEDRRSRYVFSKKCEQVTDYGTVSKTKNESRERVRKTNKKEEKTR